MNSIKKFKNLFSGLIRLVIVVIISMLIVFEGFSGGQNIWIQLATLAPVLLIALAAIGLELKKMSLASHLVLLITSFLGAARQFFLVVTSFNFSTFSFDMTFSLMLILNLIIFIYLVLMILSLYVSKEGKFKLVASDVLTASMIAFVFFFFRDGFSGAVIKILPPLVALGFGSKLFALVLLLAGVIDVPFVFLGILFNGTLFEQPLSFFIFTAIAIYLILGAIKGITKYRRS
jgi:hypothetical protein